MDERIKVGQLTETVSNALNQLCTEVVDQINEEALAVSKDAVNNLRATSPKRTGKYAKSWSQKVFSKGVFGAETRVIYNVKHYRLTHLLEHGHLASNGKRVGARPHIADAEQKAIAEFTRKVMEI